MKTKKVIAYCDPQHGWGKVKRSELVKLGIDQGVSVYSYQRGEHVYLEEDRDLGLYVAAQRALGVEVKFDCRHTNKSSKIRSYHCYQAQEV